MGDGDDTITLNINDTLLFADTFSSNDWGTATDTVAININDRGYLDGSGAGGAARIDGYCTITVNPGGVFGNFYRQRLGVDVTLNGGTFEIDGASDGSTGTNYILESGTLSGSRGVLLFDVAADGVNDRIRASSGGVFDLDEITIVLDVADGYFPQVGDSWDLFDDTASGGTGDLGDGSNISMISADGKWEFTYDLSQYANLNKGIVSLTGVTALALQDEAPIISVTPDQTDWTIKATKSLTFTIRGEQVPNDAAQSITLEALNLPTGADFPPNPEVGTSPFDKVFTWTPAVGQEGDYTLNFEASDVDGADSIRIDIHVDPAPDPLASYDEYAEFHFTEEELAVPAISDSAVDVDGDGLTNLFEYFFQTNPKLANGSPFKVSSDSGDFVVVFTSLKSPSDASVRWVHTPALDLEWDEITPAITEQQDFGQTARYEARFTQADTAGFYRISLTVGEQLLNLPLPEEGTRYDSYSEFAGTFQPRGYDEYVAGDQDAAKRWPANYGEGHVTLWKDGKFAAVCISIDDNIRNDWDFWIEAGNTYGWKFTWFLIIHPYVWDIYNDVSGTNTSGFGTLAELSLLANAGHDLQLHGASLSMNTLTEAGYEEHLVLSRAKLEAVSNKPVISFAYPKGQTESDDGTQDYASVVSQHFIAARGVGNSTSPALIDYLDTGTVNTIAILTSLTAPQPIEAAFDRLFDARSFLYSQYRGWATVNFHGISSHTTETYETLNFLQANNDSIWVGTYTEIAKYSQQRESALLDITSVTADEIVFDLADTMDDTLFDYPLTIKLRLDPSWTGISATQDGQAVGAYIVQYAGVNYAYIQAVPDQGTVVVTRQ